MNNQNRILSCTDCGSTNCNKHTGEFPEFCLTTNLTEAETTDMLRAYEDVEVHKIARVAAEVEGEFYKQYTRVQETIEFAKRMGYIKIGIATCAGLIEESRILARILRSNGFEVYSVLCKVGDIDKTAVNLDEKYMAVTGRTMCNPVLQAKLLNKAETDFNIVMGLCVGHDSLFYKFSDAPVTTLVAKDRVLGHNTCAAIYQTKSYYSHLMEK